MVYWYLVFLWVLAVVVHELGHWWAFRFFGFKPSVRLTWWGVLIGENVVLRVPFEELYLIAWAGVFLGGFVACLDWRIFGLYLLSCYFDFRTMLLVVRLRLKGASLGNTLGSLGQEKFKARRLGEWFSGIPGKKNR